MDEFDSDGSDVALDFLLQKGSSPTPPLFSLKLSAFSFFSFAFFQDQSLD